VFKTILHFYGVVVADEDEEEEKVLLVCWSLFSGGQQILIGCQQFEEITSMVGVLIDGAN